MKSNLPNAAKGRQEMVTFKVGPSESAYYIHWDIICRESSVFKTALSSDFKEGKTKEIVLDDTDEEVFEIVMHWAYTHELPGPNSEQRWKQQMVEDDEGDDVELTWDFLLSSAYVFAKRYDMALLASGIHCLFSERFETWNSKCPSVATLWRIFDNVPEDSWLCELLVNKFTMFWDRDSASDADKKLFQHLPIEFFEQACNSFAQRRDQLEMITFAMSRTPDTESSTPASTSPEASAGWDLEEPW